MKLKELDVIKTTESHSQDLEVFQLSEFPWYSSCQLIVVESPASIYI